MILMQMQTKYLKVQVLLPLILPILFVRRGQSNLKKNLLLNPVCTGPHVIVVLAVQAGNLLLSAMKILMN